MDSRVTLTDLNGEQLDHIWKNLREVDRAELNVMGLDDTNYRTILDRPHPYWCASFEGVPICAFGYHMYAATIVFGFFTTPAVAAFWKSITKYASGYIDGRCREWNGHRPHVWVWEKHDHSRRWLRHLGFHETGAAFHSKGEKVLILERIGK